jgi:enoyl-CoA hydratase/carnithine racemase
VVVTGAGEKVFVSGADVRELRDRTAKQGLEARLSRFFTDLERHPKVTIAAINGFCLGGGLELALACDIRIAAGSARFGFPETGIGILPGAGGTQRLPRLVGLGRAKHLVLTGEVIEAGAALGMGLVSVVVPLPELLRVARELAAKVLSRGPLATRLAKAALNLSGEAPLAAGLQFEAMAQSVLYQSEDKREGTTAFLEKRKPRFSGD